MIIRGKVTAWTILFLVAGLWAGYHEFAQDDKGGHGFFLIIIFAYIAFTVLMTLLFEWSENRSKKKRRTFDGK